MENRITTRADDWHKQCEKWAAAREPFQVIDANKATHDALFAFICSHYKFAMSTDGETIAVFEPLSTGKT